jgi:hypothetical protein
LSIAMFFKLPTDDGYLNFFTSVYFAYTLLFSFDELYISNKHGHDVE